MQPPQAEEGGRQPLPVEERLTAHLRAWLGTWPPQRPLHVVGSSARELPGWDGKVVPVLGVSDGNALVLSLPRDMAGRVQRTDPGEQWPAALLAEALGRSPQNAAKATWSRATFRWSTAPAALPDLGTWRSPDHPDLPSWLRPFNGEVLVALDSAGRVAAGVGRKQHTRYGHEIAVVTEAAHRGRGLARGLVARMARRILVEGAVPLYLHDPANRRSARVADAAGFPDRGWQLLELRLQDP